MTRHDSQPVALDPYDYAFQEDPYPVYAWLREHEPLHHNPALDLWALTRHADIAEAVRTEGTYSNSWGVAIEESAWGPDAHKVMSILGMDPPRQKRLRSLVSRGFTPRRVHDLLPRIQQLTDRYLAECLEMGSVRLDRRLRRQAPDGRHLRDDGRPRGGPRGGTPPGRHRRAPRGRRLRRAAGRDGLVAVAGRLLPGHGRPAAPHAERRPDQRADRGRGRRRAAHRRGRHRLPLPDGRGRQRDDHQAARPRALPPDPAPRPAREGLRRARHRAGQRRGSRRRCASTPRASCSPATCSRTSSCTARSRRRARSCCSASARPTATSGSSPAPTTTTSSATRTSSRRSCPSAAAGTSASAPTWPGSRPASR